MRTSSGGSAALVRQESGQSLLEIALAFPMLLALLLTATEVGRLACYSVAVSSAAQAGVAYGQRSPITASDTAGIALAARNDADNVSGLSVSSSHSCYCMSVGAQTAATHCLLSDCTASQRMVEYVQVNTSATIIPLLKYPGVPSSFSVSGQANARVSQ